MINDKFMEFIAKIHTELLEIKEGQLRDRESIELIATQTEHLTASFDRLETEVGGLKTRFDGLETGVKSIKEIIVRIENEQGNKINVLFDAHLQNKDKIAEHDRILKAMGKL